MKEKAGAVIEARSLTKVYGGKAAVDGIDFQVMPGLVTGFLGPNGAGKSTTMRMLLGLDLPTSGTVTAGGRGYRGTVWPLHEVGALLDARAVHPGRSAYNHLHSLAAANGITRARVDAVLETVGLTSVARKRAGGFPSACCSPSTCCTAAPTRSGPGRDSACSPPTSR
jgi:ABC-2 type transport system ATP-binding protein